MDKMNRRTFFTRAMQVAAALVVAPSFLKSTISYADGAPLPMLSPKDSAAVAVKYVENAKKSKESKGNHCSTCSFYTKKEERKGKEVGACLVFPGKLVYGEGYCNSWNKKTS